MQNSIKPAMKTMTVFVNGQSCEIDQNALLSDLLVQLGIDDTACATAVNGTFVPRQRRNETILHDTDHVMTFEPITGG